MLYFMRSFCPGEMESDEVSYMAQRQGRTRVVVTEANIDWKMNVSLFKMNVFIIYSHSYSWIN